MKKKTKNKKNQKQQKKHAHTNTLSVETTSVETQTLISKMWNVLYIIFIDTFRGVAVFRVLVHASNKWPKAARICMLKVVTFLFIV